MNTSIHIYACVCIHLRCCRAVFAKCLCDDDDDDETDGSVYARTKLHTLRRHIKSCTYCCCWCCSASLCVLAGSRRQARAIIYNASRHMNTFNDTRKRARVQITTASCSLNRIFESAYTEPQRRRRRRRHANERRAPESRAR